MLTKVEQKFPSRTESLRKFMESLPTAALWTEVLPAAQKVDGISRKISRQQGKLVEVDGRSPGRSES